MTATPTTLHLATVGFDAAAVRAMFADVREAHRGTRVRAKSAILESFGEGALRPWSPVEDGPDRLVVAGWTADPARLALTEASRRLGAAVDVRPWTVPGAGSALTMRLTAVAQREVATGPASRARVFEDPGGPVRPGEAPDSPRRRALYADWLADALARPRSGVAMGSAPEVLAAEAMTAVRKGARGPTRFGAPAVTAVLDLDVVDPAALAAFLLAGFRKAKDLGYGCLLPYGAGLPGFAR